MTKSLFLLLFVPLIIFASDTIDIFKGTVDRSTLRGKRVSISGNVNATGCDKLPCKIMAYRWFDNTKVLFIMEFQDRFEPFVSRKRVLDPIHAHCIMISDFEYSDCYY